jgi:hypothetical protein
MRQCKCVRYCFTQGVDCQNILSKKPLSLGFRSFFREY